MKVKIEVTLSVDAAAWAEEYGIDQGEVRADVKRWAAGRLHCGGHDGLVSVVAAR